RFRVDMSGELPYKEGWRKLCGISASDIRPLCRKFINTGSSCEYNPGLVSQGDGWGGRAAMNSSYGPALRRFWWVGAIGAIVASVIAFLLVYTFQDGKLVKREQPVYTAVARLFVTSGEAPYLRTTVPRYTDVPIGTGGTQTTSRPL